MSNLYLANSQYSTRPADETFASLDALLVAARRDDAAAATFTAPLSELRAKPSADGSEVLLNGKTNAARLSHWSFGQLATIAGAPGAYLRQLPARLAAECINDGLDKRTAAGDGAAVQQLFVRMPAADAGVPMIRALTSDSYTRVLDSALVAPLVAFQQSAPAWQLPMTWAGTRSGAYRGDRDSFVFLTDGGSIVDDPTLRGAPTAGPGGASGGSMFRGVIVRNSEVGACSLQLHVVLFRYICGNHIIWGVEGHGQYRRRHVGAKTAAEFYTLLRQTLKDLANRPASVDVAYVARLAAAEPWKDTAAVKLALRDLGLTQLQADASIKASEEFETNPRSVWGVVNGMTRASQDEPYAGDRLAFDLLAAQLTQHYALAGN